MVPVAVPGGKPVVAVPGHVQCNTEARVDNAVSKMRQQHVSQAAHTVLGTEMEAGRQSASALQCEGLHQDMEPHGVSCGRSRELSANETAF